MSDQPTTDDRLNLAFLVGRDSYIVDALAYRGLLDPTLAGHKLHFQIAQQGSQVWQDWLVVDEVGNVTLGGTIPPGVIRGRVDGAVAPGATLLTHAVGAADASFWVSASVLISLVTSGSVTVALTYTDEGGTAQSVLLAFAPTSDVSVFTQNLTIADTYLSPALHIRAKAGTTITLAVVVTGGTTAANAEAALSLLG